MATPDRMAVLPRWLRTRAAQVGTIVLALTAITLSICIGVASFARDIDPALALKFWPVDARALANEANRILFLRPEQPDFDQAAALARKAIDQDTTLGSSYRIIGFQAEQRGDVKSAERLIAHSDRLSRRDLLTQLWLVERAVARNDVPGALGHFDAALRTSEAAPAVLFPILSSALSDSELFPPIAAKLAERPNWANAFLVYSMQNNGDPRALASLLLRLRQWPEVRAADLAPTVIASLVKRGDAALARRLSLIFAGIDSSPRQTVVDPGMTLAVGVPPFAWAVADGNGVSVSRSDDGVRVEFSADALGYPLGQILALPPGRYRLQTMANQSGAAGSAVYWQVACDGAATQLLVQLVLSKAPTVVSSASEFTVPEAGCRAQGLSLVVKSPSSSGEGFVRRVDIVSLAPDAPRR